MKALVIALAGRAGSGKSSCANFLVEYHGFTRMSLADPLKNIAQKVFGFTDEQVRGSQDAKERVDPRWGISPREALIRLGHNTRIELWEDVWVESLVRRVSAARLPRVVIDDVRYANEARFLTAQGGVVFKLECPDSHTKVDPNAPSEKSVDEIPPMLFRQTLVVSRSANAGDLIGRFEKAVAPILVQRSFEHTLSSMDL